MSDEGERLDSAGGALGRALEVVSDGGNQVRVHVRSASPSVERWVASRDDVLVLRSDPCVDCFDAFSTGVDALVGHLDETSGEWTAPEWAGALCVAFPRFRALAEFADADEPAPALEGHERRRQAFEALHAVLTDVARRQPTVVWLRGLEHADADSIALLDVLTTEDPDHRPPPLVLVLDYLPEPEPPPRSMLAWLEADRARTGAEAFEITGDATPTERPESADMGLDEAIAAGDRARDRLAFARASECYAQASWQIEPGATRSRERRAELAVAMGRARLQAGERSAAAGHFQRASELLASISADRQVRALELRAATLYIADGQLGKGWRLLESLLRTFEVQIPSTAAEALLRANWRRGRFLLRRDLSATSNRPFAARTKARLDTLWFTSTRLAVVSRALSDALRTQHLEAVAQRGDPSTRARALAYEVAVESHIGAPFDRATKRLLDACEALCAQSGDPVDAAWHACAVAANEFSHGRWRRCVEACERAETLLADHRDVSWERSMVASYHWFALAWLGELARLRPIVRHAAALASERDEPFNIIETYGGQPTLAWLAADRADEVLDHLRPAIARITGDPEAGWPENSYRRQHYCDLVAQVHIGLYQGDVTTAWGAMLSQWRDLELSYFVSMRTVGLELRSARARAALGILEQCIRDEELTKAKLHALPGHPGGAWPPARLQADVRRQLDAIRKDPACFAPPLADLIEAGLRNLDGERHEARRLLDAAVRGFSAVDMLLHREAARYALGELVGSEEGRAMREQAWTWMTEQEVAQPRQLARSQAVGFGL